MSARALFLDLTGPAAGGAVMGTGIMSIALRLTGHGGLSLALLWVTAALWGVLGVALIARALIDRPRMMRELRTPAALTGIAGTAVLGARLGDHGWTWAPALALVVAGILCPAVILPVVRGIGRTVTGEAFLITVALEALAVLGAIVSEQHRSAALAALALALLIGGVAAYPWVAIRFDREQIAVGTGAHWVTGGALAIATLAANHCADALQSVGAERAADALARAAVVLLVLGAAWLPVLVIGEARHRRWHYHPARWATVFPLGMYTVAAFTTGVDHGPRVLTVLAEDSVWAALAVWTLTALGAARYVLLRTGVIRR